MFDLKAGVYLEKKELLRRRIENELHGSGRAVLHGAAHSNRGIEEPVARHREETRGRRLFDDLLVAALDRAIAFAQNDDLPLTVPKDLDLHVAGALDELFEESTRLAEVRASESLDRLEGLGKLRFASADTQPDAASARGALEGSPDSQSPRRARPQPWSLQGVAYR